MHESLDPHFKINVDAMELTSTGLFLEGWCASATQKINRLICADSSGKELGEFQYKILRGDVFDHYSRKQLSFLESGFRGEIANIPQQQTLHILGVLSNDERVLLYKIEPTVRSTDFPLTLSRASRTDVIVVDNFYADPDEVRAFALKQEFFEQKEYYKGVRTQTRFATEQMKSFFEKALGRKVTKWEYPTNGIFQHCVATEPVVYHIDTQMYAAVIFLNPDAPLETGTDFFRSKSTGVRNELEIPNFKNGKSKDQILSDIFAGGFYDRTKFERTDSVANIYNRLVIWNAKAIHAAGGYFGTTKENSRLFQLFFFDIE